MESYLGTGTFSQRTGRGLAKPSEETHCEGDVSLQGVSGGSCSECEREGEKHRRNVKWCSSHFSPVASLLLQHSTSIVAKTFKYKIQ